MEHYELWEQQKYHTGTSQNSRNNWEQQKQHMEFWNSEWEQQVWNTVEYQGVTNIRNTGYLRSTAEQEEPNWVHKEHYRLGGTSGTLQGT